MKINVLYDGRVLQHELQNNADRTGIYFVAMNLIKQMVKRNDIDLYIYLPTKNLNLSDDILKSLDIENIKILTDNDDLSRINSFFSPLSEYPHFIKNYPTISCYTVLHDTIPLLYPEYYKHNNMNWYYNIIDSLNKEDYYFPNSHHTAQDFLNYFPFLDKNKMQIIPLSTNFKYKPNKDRELLEKVRNKYNIPTGKKYLFSLCSLEQRKNLIMAVKSFIKFIDKNKIDNLVYVLGGGAWKGFIEKLYSEVPNLADYSDRIICAGYVDDEDLEILYSNAEWFIYTSQYEGFGMPPLEAMNCGCPVITSNNTSLPEVVGDAGIMIDYDSEQQHIQAYENYFYNPELRKIYSEKGLERAKMFSWEKAVDIIINKMIEVENKKRQTPLVTVITATYNLIKNKRRDFFIQNLESVHNQTYKNIEHIVIDGASTDGTLDLLEEYQNKGYIKYFSEPDEGIYDAINKGILKANGKYVVCLNSDDFYCDKQAVEWLVKKAEELDADACYGDADRVNPTTLELMSHWKGKENFVPLIGSFPCHQTFLIKTDMMKELDLYDTKYKVSADNVFLTKLVNNNKNFTNINKTIITFRDGGFSNSHMDISHKDRVSGFFEVCGKFNKLTKLDCNRILYNKFLELPLTQAIELGSKLVYTGNKDWIKYYFNVLLNHHLAQRKIVISNKKETYKLFNIIPLIKIVRNNNKTNVLLFSHIPLIKIKRKNEYKQKIYLFSFIPLFKIKSKPNKSYVLLFNFIPFLKINKKIL